MRRFSKKYPEVRYEISEGNTYELLEMLRQGRIEVALARTPFPTEGLSCVYLEAEPMMAGERLLILTESRKKRSLLVS